MSVERIAEIEARVNAATEGPWTWVDNCFNDDPAEMRVDHGWQHQGPDLVAAGPWYPCEYRGCRWADWPNASDTSRLVEGTNPASNEHEHLGRDVIAQSWGHDADGLTINRADAELIEHAREDIPWLLEQLRAAETKIEAVRALCHERLAPGFVNASVPEMQWHRRETEIWRRVLKATDSGGL